MHKDAVLHEVRRSVEDAREGPARWGLQLGSPKRRDVEQRRQQRDSPHEDRDACEEGLTPLRWFRMRLYHHWASVNFTLTQLLSGR